MSLLKFCKLLSFYSLNEELRLIKLEYSRIPQPDVLEATKRQTKKEIDVLKQEKGQQSLEIKNLQVSSTIDIRHT